MRVVGNLGNQIQERAQTPGENESTQPDDDAKRTGNIVHAISSQPEDGAERAEYNPNHAGDFQRARPAGLAGDPARTKSGVVNAVAEVNHDPDRKPVNQPLPR